MHENIMSKASSVLALLYGVRNAGIEKTDVEYVIDCAEEAFLAYKQAKELHIKEVANKWKDQIDPRVYEALMNYTVEITD